MLLSAALLSSGAIRAQDSSSVTSDPSAALPAGASRLNAEDAETWLDGYMPYALERGSIPGAVVVIVKDGRVLIEKGYGVSDVAAGTDVDPHETLFRIGSISKLFTWTAVMQLVETGQLDLDTDINRYLDFEIPAFEGQPVTLRNLMTHTAGFEEAVGGIATEAPDRIPSLGAALKRWIPTRVYTPGTTTAYSNYGAALAGYIVERVSGERFDAYIATHIFAPLGMLHSTFQQPLPAAFSADMSKGYLNRETAPGAYELVVWQPVGSVSTTADDMSRFMIAHLQNGRYGTASILQPKTAETMHATAPILLPLLDRMDLGFYVEHINGHRVIGHDGDTVYFHAGLKLYLDDNVGLFVALNGVGKDDAVYGVRAHLFQAFSDRYMPGSLAKGSIDPATARMHASMFADSYVGSRAWHSSFMSAFSVFFPTTVVTNLDGTISVSILKTLSGGLRRYREIEPFVWRDVDAHDRLVAIVKDNKIVRFSSDELASTMFMDAVPWWRSAALLIPAALASLFAIFSTVVAWPVAALVRRHYGVAFTLQGQRAVASRLIHIMAVLFLAALAGWAWIVSIVLQPTGVYLLGNNLARIYGIELLSIVGFVGGFAASLFGVFVAWRTASSWFAKLWSIVLVLSMSTWLWIGCICKLLNLNARF